MIMCSKENHTATGTRAVILDFDDTLMATRECRTVALRATLKELGSSDDLSNLGTHWGKPFRELITQIAPEVDYDTFVKLYSKVMKRYPPRPTPGAAQLLTSLASNGKLILVLSSGSRALVMQDLEEALLWQYVSKLWGFEDTDSHKPNPRVLDPVLRHLELSDVERESALYIGDSMHDFIVAEANGIPFCACLTGFTGREAFLQKGLSEYRIVSSLQELLNDNHWFRKTLLNQ